MTEATKFKLYYGQYSQVRTDQSNTNQIGYKNKTGTLYVESSLVDADMEESIHYGAGASHFLSECVLVKTEVFYKKYDQLLINTISHNK